MTTNFLEVLKDQNIFSSKFFNEFEDYSESKKKEKLFELIFMKQKTFYFKKNKLIIRKSKMKKNLQNKLVMPMSRFSENMRKNFFKKETKDLHQDFCQILIKNDKKIIKKELKIRSKSIEMYLTQHIDKIYDFQFLVMLKKFEREV